MRIISGDLKGRKLQMFRGMAVRPTPDRVREALFNILAHQPRTAVVLDLFAGTGALGIEALSRGARSALFVDISSDSLAILRKNLQHCRLTEKSRSVQWDISKNLNCLKGYAHNFDLVFLDPPYGRDLVPKTISHLLEADCLAPVATIVAEHEAGLHWQPLDAGLRMIDSRRYGRTQLTFFSLTSGLQTVT